jgi:hypothetical protein
MFASNMASYFCADRRPFRINASGMGLWENNFCTSSLVFRKEIPKCQSSSRLQLASCNKFHYPAGFRKKYKLLLLHRPETTSMKGLLMMARQMLSSTVFNFWAGGPRKGNEGGTRL